MTPAQYIRARDVFIEACELPRGERTKRIMMACGEDPEVSAAVMRMIQESMQPLEMPVELPRAADLIGLLDDLEKEPEEVTPEFIGPYRVIRKLGQGGMGAVYEAEQDVPRRTVAIKVLRGGLGASLRRFRREIEVLGRLQHPGIARVYGAGTAAVPGGQAPYFIMELVHGATLAKFASQQRLSIEDRLRLVASVCEAVQYAHQRGVIHCDLKPANILVEDDAGDADGDQFRARVLDFGIARLAETVEHTSIQTEVGQIIGTLSYMSPEQVSGEPGAVDTRADVYSLGVILYELLAGRLPHNVQGRAIPEAIRIITQGSVVPLGRLDAALRGDVEAIVNKAMEPDKERRYASAGELASEIGRYLDHQPITARPLTAVYQIRMFARRNRGLVGGLAAAGVALVIGIGGTSLGLYRAIQSERRAAEGEAAARREAYRVALAAADAVTETDPVRAIGLLEGAPADLRGWEWDHFRNRLDHTVAVLQSDPGSVSIAVDPARGPIAALARGSVMEIVELPEGIKLATCTAAGGGTLTAPMLAKHGGRVVAVRGGGDLSGAAAAACVFDARSGAALAEIAMAGGTAFLSDEGRYLVCDETGGQATVWEVDSGRRIRTIPAPPGDGARMMRWIDEERLLLQIRRDDGTSHAECFDPAKGECEGGDSRAMAKLDAMDWRGDLVVSNPVHNLDRRVVEVQSLSGMRRPVVLRGHSDTPIAAAISEDGSRVATTAHDGTVRVWDASTGQCERVIAVEGVVRKVIWAGAMMACEGAEGRATLLSLDSGSVRVLAGHQGFVYHASFSTDSGLVATAGWKDAVRVWDASSGAPVAVLDRAFVQIYPPDLAGFTRDGRSLFVLEQGGSVSEWGVDDIRAGIATRNGNLIRTAAIASDPLAFATPTARYIQLQGGQVRAVSYEGNVRAVGVGDGRVRIEDGRGGLVREIRVDERLLRAVAIAPGEHLLAACGDNAEIQLWDLRKGTMLRRLSRHTGVVFSLQFSPDGTRLVSGGNDNSIVIWNTASWEPVAELRGHSQYVASVAFSPDGRRIVSASGDKTVRIWDCGRVRAGR